MMMTDNYFGERCKWSVPGWHTTNPARKRDESSPDYVDCTHDAHQEGFAVRCRPETCPILLAYTRVVDHSLLAPKNDATDSKPDMSLLPMDVLRDWIVPAYEEGIIKYERESWRKGFQVSRLIAAARRHMTAFYHDGEDYDPDAAALGVRKHHLAGAVFSLLSVLHTLDTRPDLDDRPTSALGPKASGKVEIDPNEVDLNNPVYIEALRRG